MDRRHFIAAAVSPFLITRPLSATTSCAPTAFGVGCRSEVNFAAFAQQAYQQQYLPQWCWAASISMLFAYYGHSVSQARIVTEAYGSPVNMPAFTGIVRCARLQLKQ